MSEPGFDKEAEEWYAARQKEIEGKCRYGVTCAIFGKTTDLQNMPQPTPLWKTFINEWVDFIMTGK